MVLIIEVLELVRFGIDCSELLRSSGRFLPSVIFGGERENLCLVFGCGEEFCCHFENHCQRTNEVSVLPLPLKRITLHDG